MIFALVFFPWLYLASEPLDLLLLAAAAVIRILYVQGSLPRVEFIIVLLWFLGTLLGAAYHEGPQSQAEFAILLFCKLALGALVLLHLVHQFLHSPIRHAPLVRQVWLFLGRSFELLRVKFEETAFWVGQRLRHTFRRKDLGLFSWPRKLAIGAAIWAEGIVSILGQLVEFERGLSTAVAARGGFPSSNDWITRSPMDRVKWWALSAADVALAAALLLPILYGERAIVPDQIITFAARYGIGT